MPGERRQQPDHDGRDDDDHDEVDEDDDDHGGRDDDDEDDDDNFHQSVSGAKMNVPMPEPQMAMPENNFKDSWFQEFHPNSRWCVLLITCDENL